MLATAIVSPKLLLHIFVGSRLAAIAEHGDEMDARTKAVTYLSIVLGVSAGIATGYFMYSRTKARAAQLEAEERDNARLPDDEEAALGIADEYAYSDDPLERDATDAIRAHDGISLHTADGEEDAMPNGRKQQTYRDEFTDDFGPEEEEEAQDARSLDEVFATGDGDDDDVATHR